MHGRPFSKCFTIKVTVITSVRARTHTDCCSHFNRFSPHCDVLERNIFEKLMSIPINPSRFTFLTKLLPHMCASVSPTARTHRHPHTHPNINCVAHCAYQPSRRASNSSLTNNKINNNKASTSILRTISLKPLLSELISDCLHRIEMNSDGNTIN